MFEEYVTYINTTLGIKANCYDWAEANKLPYHLQTDYKYKVLSILSEECLVIKVSRDQFDLSRFLKQINHLEKYTNNQLILGFESLTSYQRLALIRNKIPFIVPNNQLYLPFMGIVLQEYYRSQPKRNEKLTAMAQFLLLNFIYNPELNMLSKAEIADQVRQSNMNISRSIQELKALGLIEEEKSGRRSLVINMYDRKEMYKKAKQFMINPVQKKVYIKGAALTQNLPVAGLEALSLISFLNISDRSIRAIDKKEFRMLSKDLIIDTHQWETSFDIVELEIWKYNPQMLAMNNIVDPISLSLSLKDSNDERIEIEIEKIMEDYNVKGD